MIPYNHIYVIFLCFIVVSEEKIKVRNNIQVNMKVLNEKRTCKNKAMNCKLAKAIMKIEN